MREIKFRVWVEAPDDEKAMHYPKLISFGSGQLSWATLQDDSVLKDNGWFTKREVMQYTGLKDKNGKEIYEGDIVRTNKGVASVDFDDGQFTTRVGRLSEMPAIIVIGNIYQHSELLK